MSQRDVERKQAERAANKAKLSHMTGKLIDWEDLDPKMAGVGIRIAVSGTDFVAYVAPGRMGPSFVEPLCDLVWNVGWDGRSTCTKNRDSVAGQVLEHDPGACILCKAVGARGWSFGCLHEPAPLLFRVCGACRPAVSRKEVTWCVDRDEWYRLREVWDVMTA